MESVEAVDSRECDTGFFHEVSNLDIWTFKFNKQVVDIASVVSIGTYGPQYASSSRHTSTFGLAMTYRTFSDQYGNEMTILSAHQARR